MTVDINTSKLDVRINNLKGILGRAEGPVIRDLALQLERNMKKEAPVDTGRLRNSIESQISQKSARVGTSVKYARMVAEGTRAHRITPRQKQALSWPGGPGPRKSVNHPGTKANPFHLRAANTLKAEAKEVAENTVRRILGGV